MTQPVFCIVSPATSFLAFVHCLELLKLPVYLKKNFFLRTGAMFELPVAIRVLCNKQPQKPQQQTIAVYFTCLESTGSGSPDRGWACLHILGLTSCQLGRPQLGQLRGLGHAPRVSHPPAGQPGHALLMGMAEVQERTSRNRQTL